MADKELITGTGQRKNVLVRLVAGIDSLEPAIQRMHDELGGIGQLVVQPIGPIAKGGVAPVGPDGRPQAVLGFLVVACSAGASPWRGRDPADIRR